MDTSLKDQLLPVFQYTYLSSSNNMYKWYATKSTLELLTHIYASCAHISAAYIGTNNKKLWFPYNAE